MGRTQSVLDVASWSTCKVHVRNKLWWLLAICSRVLSRPHQAHRPHQARCQLEDAPSLAVRHPQHCGWTKSRAITLAARHHQMPLIVSTRSVALRLGTRCRKSQRSRVVHPPRRDRQSLPDNCRSTASEQAREHRRRSGGVDFAVSAAAFYVEPMSRNAGGWPQTAHPTAPSRQVSPRRRVSQTRPTVVSRLTPATAHHDQLPPSLALEVREQVASSSRSHDHPFIYKGISVICVFTLLLDYV